MGSKKKKWYQTGEFEDGYQFGDIFRTIKNAIDKDEEKPKKSKNKTTKVSQNKKEAQTKKSNNANAFLPKVEKGKVSFDPAVQLYGFENETERQNYIKENPNLYAVMGGYKYEPSVLSKNYIPLTDEGKKIIQQAQEKDAYLGSIEYQLDKEDADRGQQKRSNGQSLTDREIEAELKIDWAKNFVTNEELAEQTKLAKEINTAVKKFESGEDITFRERLLLSQNGGEKYTGGNTYKTIDFLAIDNPEREIAKNAAMKAIEKEKSGETLSEKEKQDIAYFGDYEYMRRSISSDKLRLTDDIKQNTENLNTVAAVDLYNDSVYKTGVEKTISQMDLYLNTGMSKYVQDNINTAVILMTERAYGWGLSDKRASDALEDIPQNKYEIANDAVAEYFTRNDKKFSKFVQDTMVSMAYNAIPMALGGISGGASMLATGLSVFGGSYKEAVKLAPEAEEWRYWLYAGINTSVELCMEKVLSGDKNVFANSSSDFSEAMFKTLTKNISNKTLLKGAYILSNSTGELFEESIQGLLSPILQKTILGADVVSILSINPAEQRQALKNAMYDGLVGFASAGITTGTLGNDVVNSIQQKHTIGAYYNKIFNELDIDVNDVAVYLKEISGGKNTDLYNSAEAVLNGDKSDSAVADMMLNGFEQSREAQRFVYTKIGEQLNKNNRYTADKLIKQYEKLSSNGIGFSKSITDTYNELVNADENTSKGTFNYLVGKLSATMDAVLPRASVEAEVVKKISDDIEENGLPRSQAVSAAASVGASARRGVHRTPAPRNDNVKIDKKAFVEGLWGRDEKVSSDDGAKSVENSGLKLFDNVDESGIIKETINNGIPGEYPDNIVWQRRNVPARKVGKGYFGKRTKQYDLRVDSYELKLNPNDESYFLIHPDGKPVQFENMKNGVVQDCKLVRGKNSIYYVKEKIPILNKNILEQAKRQSEAANSVGYKVEWLVSDQKAVEQIEQLFDENNLDIIVTYYPE